MGRDTPKGVQVRWDAERLRTLVERLLDAGLPPAPVVHALGLGTTVRDHYPSLPALWAEVGLVPLDSPPLQPHLREHRQARGWSLEEVGRCLGVSQRLVSQWELGQATPSLAHALALARVLGVPADTLWTLADPARPAEIREGGDRP